MIKFVAMIFFKLLAFVLFLQTYNFSNHVYAAENNCASIADTDQYRSLRENMPPAPLPEFNGKYCGRSEKTCCNSDVETHLRELGKMDYEKVVKKILSDLSKMFKSKSSRFNEYFKDLLSKSKKDFHEMFKKTYGIVYEQNSYVFSDFFNELESYFSHGKSNLADMMDTFFNILYQKMFTVMNGQYKFDDKYLGCVSEHMNELKPFGDVPQKLSLPLKRSFVAARVYSQSLNVVGDIIANLINLMPGENCFDAITKMSHCSLCKGLPSAKICQDFCLNVMKGCLAFHSELDTEWNNFVDALHRVQQRLLGPFNLELVVEPINVKISEAIMNFQESSNHVSSKVFNGCGRPPMADSKRRRRRQAESNRRPDQRNNMRASNSEEENNEGRRRNRNNSDTESNRSPNKSERGGRRKGGRTGEEEINLYSSSPIDGFLKFIQEVGDYVLSTKFFWKRLPHNVCSDEMSVEKNRSTSCWNGNTIGKYDIPEIQDGLRNQQYNQEVSVDPKRPLTVINEQLFTLKSVTSQLRNAYNGHDVDWIDNEDAFDSSSGSGMFPDNENMGSFNPIEGSGFDPSSKYSTRLFDSTTSSSGTGSGSAVDQNASTQTSIGIVPGDPSSSTTTYVDGNATVSSIDISTIGNRFNITDTSNRNITTSDGSSIQKMSVNQAIATYLLPTAVIWIGGSFNEWFHTFECHFLF